MKRSNMKQVLGFALVATLFAFAGCGKTSSGNAALPQAPYVIALSQPAGSGVPGSLYALSPTQGTVQKMDLNVGLIPNSMLLDGDSLYVVNAGDATVSVITITESTSTIYIRNKGLISFTTTGFPEYITVTTAAGVEKGYVSLNGTNQVAVLNMTNDTVMRYVDIKPYSKTWAPGFEAHPWGLAAVNGKIMVANNGAQYLSTPPYAQYASPGMVSVITPATDAVSEVTTTTGINLQAVEPLTQTGFVVISADGYNSTINGYAELFDNGFRETGAVQLSGSGAAIAISSSTGMGYVASGSMVGYDEIDTNTGTFVTTTDLSKQVSGLTGYNLTSIKFAPDGTLWATDWQDNMVFEIDPSSNTVIQTFKLPEPAQDVVFVY